jgi:heat-inducible transcriptional repressor
VMKGMIERSQAIDAGLLEWARTYLNEMLHNRTLTTRLIRRVFDNPELSPRESAFLFALAPAFEKLVDEQYQDELYVGGTAGGRGGPRARGVWWGGEIMW